MSTTPRKPWAIKVESVSKKFGLTLKQSMKYGLRDTVKRLVGRDASGDDLREGEFWAVKDVSFELRGGEAMGIMGVNGSGKTTLLRILNGAFSPDTGRAQLRGRVGAMIAAGAGFAPMLSGRENVYINAALLGLNTCEIDDLMDEIIAFSELGDFIDLPVKNYSSGMHVRLGFAIAALSRPDVLLMDEVLAVGDLNFQKKCFDHILQLKRAGTAIILVSHSPGAIWSVCDRGLFIDHGYVKNTGLVEDVIRAYDDQNSRNAIAATSQFDRAVSVHGKADDAVLASEFGHSRGGTGDVTSNIVRLFDGKMRYTDNEFEFMESIVIDAAFNVAHTQEDLHLRFTIDAMHYRSIATLDSCEQGLEMLRVEPGCYRLKVFLKNPNLRPGAYKLNVSASRKGLGVHLCYWFGAANFVIKDLQSVFLYSEPNAVIHLHSEFNLQSLPAAS
jgi:lipopolysaccharide transport system ATP-binding protein